MNVLDIFENQYKCIVLSLKMLLLNIASKNCHNNRRVGVKIQYINYKINNLDLEFYRKKAIYLANFIKYKLT